eukprot:9489959-Pyramimonas_sp.AAC.1
MVAHHHPRAESSNCPATWKDPVEKKFPLQAALAVIQGTVSTADPSALAFPECAICALCIDVLGPGIGLNDGPAKQASCVAWMGGGYSCARPRLGASAPPGPRPGVTLRP